MSESTRLPSQSLSGMVKKIPNPLRGSRMVVVIVITIWGVITLTLAGIIRVMMVVLFPIRIVTMPLLFIFSSVAATTALTISSRSSFSYIAADGNIRAVFFRLVYAGTGGAGSSSRTRTRPQSWGF